ncbi:MAG: PHP domain-containing protein [Burkholderiales bacterium]
MKYDLHCHSTASDGTLSPTELVTRAHRNGVTALAITDHDVTDAYDEANAAAQSVGMRFIAGVEISVTWYDKTLHIVGLGLNIRGAALVDGLAQVRLGRVNRGKQIGEELAKLGIHGSLEAALLYAGDPQTLSRTHFARFLVEKGYARDVKSVFHQYLGEGKPGYVPHCWASLADAVSWIVASGGVAVIAHPGRYGLSQDKAKLLVEDFKNCGGVGIEVLTGSHTAEQSRLYGQVARKYDLAASCGSDFHSPAESRVDLGGLPPLPPGLRPIWDLLPA